MPNGSGNSFRGRSQTSKAKGPANLFYRMKWSGPVMISDVCGKLRKTPSHAAKRQFKCGFHYWRTSRERNAQPRKHSEPSNGRRSTLSHAAERQTKSGFTIGALA